MPGVFMSRRWSCGTAGALAACLLLASLAGAQQAPPAAAPSAASPSIEDFTRYDDFGGILLSPDGAFAAALGGKHGRGVLAFLSMKDGKRLTGVRAREGSEFYDFRWISGRRVMYRLAERQLNGVLAMTGEIAAIDVDGKNHEFLYGYRAGTMQTGTHIPARQSSYATAELISTLKGDDRNVLMSEQPWKRVGDSYYVDRDAKPVIILLDVYSGRKRSLGRSPLIAADILADAQDRVRIAVGLNSKLKYAVSWKPEPEGGWQDFDLPGFNAETIVPKILGQDSQSLYFLGVAEGERWSALFRLDLQSRAVTRIYGFPDADISEVVYDLGRKRIIGVQSYVDKRVTHWLDGADPAARVAAALQRSFPGQNIDIASSTDDGQLAVVMVSSSTNPGDYYLFDTKAMKAQYIQPARKWIDPAKMRPKEPFTFKARDGLELHGYLTRPVGDGPYPVVVLPHGGPHGIREYWEFDWESQLLAARGYAVLQVNYRGSGGFGNDFIEMGYREWGGKIQDDLTDSLRWAIEQKIADGNRACIVGASFGGYSALRSIEREPGLYRCAVGIAGIYDLELMYESGDVPIFRTGEDYLDKVVGRDVAQLREFSPVRGVQKIQVPVLLIHGKEDQRADFEQARRMKVALDTAGKKYEWRVLRGEGHGIHDEETRAEVYASILEFLDRNLRSR
jgi:dipeptidyl aminopeptidase/acylaminoacyl peptidase